MRRKTALITGVTGQDGYYLSKLLLSKGYDVHGIVRRSSVPNTSRISSLLDQMTLHNGDLTDTGSLIRIIERSKPDEIYNLGAQSHVGVSFDTPEFTTNTDGMGALRLLEALRILKTGAQVRFYQASSSELFGNTKTIPQNENTPFEPCSPYGAAKLYAYWIVKNYRNAYGMHASNGILFNHESPMRGEEFVTKKITKAVAEINLGKRSVLELGNLDARRDWGHAKDYVRGMWMMMQQENPDDYVLATGRSETVRWFVEKAFESVGIEIKWGGQGVDETGYDKKSGKLYVRVNPGLYRPVDVGLLCGDASKAKKQLGWIPEISLETMIKDMVRYDLK